MVFPFRVKEYRDTSKKNGYMYVFESQLGEEISVYVKNEVDQTFRDLYPLGSVHRLNVVARSGSGGPELVLKLKEDLADDYLF